MCVYIGCFNIHETHVTANNSTNDNVPFFCFRFENSILLMYTHLHTYAYTHIYIYKLDTYRRTDNRRRKKQRKKTSLEKYSPLTLLQEFERGCSRFACERVLETEHKLHILTPLLWPSRCVFLVLLMLGSTPSGVFPRAPSVGCGLPYHIWSLAVWEVCWQLLWHPTQLNYIIIQRPRDRPLDLWNRMFNRHQAEITVMQFRGYSLPVHHYSGTMGPSPCPIS